MESAASGDDESVDAAFGLCEAIAGHWSAETASAIEARWLWGDGWKTVAASLGCSTRQARRRCMSALRWADRNVEMRDGIPVYVGVKIGT